MCEENSCNDRPERADILNQAQTKCVEPSQPTRRDRLAAQRQRLVNRLSRLNAAIAALDSNPELARLVDLIENA